MLDAVGYAASIFHRGVRHVRLPTTVLAQADSGVGVKNAVNAFGTKNLVGVFAPPFAIVNDGGFTKVERMVVGGPSRHISEHLGLLAFEADIAAGRIDTVLVHDAVRPFVTAERVEAVVEEVAAPEVPPVALPVEVRPTRAVTTTSSPALRPLVICVVVP